MKHFIIAFSGTLAVIAGVIGLVLTAPTSAPADTQPGPSNGQVVNLGHSDVFHGDYGTVKWCDGLNLVYESKYSSSGGIAVIPNSMECQ